MGLFGNHTRVGASAAGDYEIEKSLRFNSNDDTYLHRTPSGAGNRKTWTWSGWVKRSSETRGVLFSCGTSLGSSEDGIEFDGLVIRIYTYTGSFGFQFTTNAQYRDPSAWMHIVFSLDTTQSSSGERGRLYVNGERVTSLATETQPSLNADCAHINTTSEHKIGNQLGSHEYDGYLAEVNFIDGIRLDASSFGETDVETGQWIPKKYGGSYGTNGFYLNFSDDSGTTATTLGKDSSGNGNNWTPSGFSVSGASTDSFEDTPTNNFPVLNRNQTRSSADDRLHDGNLSIDWQNAHDNAASVSTFGMASGKWYFEVLDRTDSAGQGSAIIGIFPDDYFEAKMCENTNAWPGYESGSGVGFNGADQWYINGSNQGVYGGTWAENDIIGVAVDIDTGKIALSKNGQWADGSGNYDEANINAQKDLVGAGPYYAAFCDTSASHDPKYTVNFGQRPFSYTIPTGYKKLCSKNLPEPPIKDPSKYFNTGIYTGTGSSHAITGLGFQPDKVVVKMRATANQDFQIFDAVRGANKVFRWNTQETSDTQTTRLTSFDSDGFTVGTENITNQSGKSFVYWAWKESATAGFDMVKYTGNGSSPRTVSHSLGVVPELYIIKNMETNSTRWIVGNKSMDADENMFLNSVDDDENLNNFWASTRPTSSVFTVNDDDEVNKNGDEHIAYLWSSVEGMCKVGSYSGNGSNTGAFLHLGFRPSFFLAKNTNDNAAWMLYDDSRGENPNNPYIVPSGYNSMVELNDIDLDIVSNGIKFRYSHNNINFVENGAAYIYLAMARSPFKYARAR